MEILVCLIILSSFITVDAVEPYITITKTEPANRNGIIRAISGQAVTLTCYAENVDPDVVNVIWQRLYQIDEDHNQLQEISSNTDLPDNTKFSVDKPTSNTWRLRIRNVQVADAATYTCSVRTTIISRKEESMYLQVFVKPLLDPTQTSSNMVRKVGDTITLGCNGTGLPTPVIRWTRLGGAPLPHPINREVFNEARMVIADVKAIDRGTYRCMIMNSVGVDRRDIKLDIRFQPIINVPRTEIYQAVGYRIELQCLVEANPFPGEVEVSWILGARTMSVSTDRLKVKALEGAFNQLTYELIIMKVKKSDFGDYRCRITNSLGTTYGNIKLIESDKPFASFKLGRIVAAAPPSRFNILTTVLLCLVTYLLH